MCKLGAFIICWTPGLVLLLLDVFCPDCNVLTYEKFFLLLAEFNSAMNPIIYSYRDKEMSATFKQILCCQRNEGSNSAAEGSDRSASSLNHTILSGIHNDHSMVCISIQRYFPFSPFDMKKYMQYGYKKKSEFDNHIHLYLLQLPLSQPNIATYTMTFYLLQQPLVWHLTKYLPEIQ
eukprot:g46339.t1